MPSRSDDLDVLKKYYGLDVQPSYFPELLNTPYIDAFEIIANCIELSKKDTRKRSARVLDGKELYKYITTVYLHSEEELNKLKKLANSIPIDEERQSSIWDGSVRKIKYNQTNYKYVRIFLACAAQIKDSKSLEKLTTELITHCIEEKIHILGLERKSNLISNVLQGESKETLSIISTVTSEENWLSPRNDTFIPFIGRSKEISQLNAFATGDLENKNTFKLWAIVGPSGAGKTRLLTHWANSNIWRDWKAIDVNSNTEIDWKNWLPLHPTLIFIDYIYGYDKVIADIISRAEIVEFSYPVRLLLLDHTMPDTMAELLKDPRWGFEGNRPEIFSILEERFFFSQAPLKLTVSENDDTFMAKIICSVAYKEQENPFESIGDTVVQKGVYYLKETVGAWQPLFAALVGDAIKNDTGNLGAYTSLNRRALIKHYLQGKTRLTWQLDERDKGTLAACFVAAATACRKVDFNTLRLTLSQIHKETIDRNYKGFKSLCNGIVSGNDKKELKAFEPDILGETHFLLLLKEIEENLPDFENVLTTLIATTSVDRTVEEFIAFIIRLVRNLSNDEQTSETHLYWRLLLIFLESKQYLGEPYKWAKSIACFESYFLLNEKGQVKLANMFLDRVDAERLYSPRGVNNDPDKVVLAIQLAGLKEGAKKHIPASLLEYLAFWDRKLCYRGLTALMLAVIARNSTIASYLIENHCVNDPGRINQHLRRGQRTSSGLISPGSDPYLAADTADGWTALMLACKYNQGAIALALAEKNANIGARTMGGSTALMLACESNLEAVALTLVEKNANLSAKCNEGWTALMLACRYNLESVALALVEKNANLSAQFKEGWTALMFACKYNLESVAMALVKRNANLSAQSKEGLTALMIACQCNLKAVALALVERDTKLDAQSDQGRTALMDACQYEQENVALALVKKNANLSAQTKEGWTALMFACHYRQKKVAKELIEKNLSLEAKNKKGATALIHATNNNQVDLVQELLIKGVNTDEVWETDERRFTALGLARYGRNYRIVEILESVGALEVPPHKPPE